jgi:NhaP-type Na+/H+ or K+/H+ antiporter
VITDPVAATGLILAVGILAQWLGWRLRIPAIVFLLGSGVVLGPALGWLDPDATYGDLLFPAVSIAVAVILFEGALHLGSAGIHAGAVVGRLLTVGALITLVGGAIAAELLLGVERELAWLLAAVLVVTGPTVIGPLVRSIGLRGRAGRILQAEGILIDPLGAVLVVLLFEALFEPGHHSVPVTLLILVVTGLGFGLATAGLLTLVLGRFLVPDHLQSITTLTAVIAAFAASEQVQPESGLLTVTVAGVALGRQRWARVKDVLAFNETLGAIFISGVFVVLGARITASTFSAIGVEMLLFLVVMVVLVRPLAVLASTLGSQLARNERIFLAATAPRGIVAAAIASLFSLRLGDGGTAQGQVLVTATFTVITGTVVLSGFGALPLARRLGLVERGEGPIVVVGAGPFPRALAETLCGIGVEMTLIATDEDDRRAAKMAGLRHTSGSVLEPATWERAALDSASSLLALDRTDEINTVAARHAVEVLGRRTTFQATTDPERRSTVAPVDVVGQPLFDAEVTAAELDLLVLDGWEVRTTPFTPSFSWREFRRVHPEAIPLAVVRDGRVRWLVRSHRIPISAGDTVISLRPPEPRGDDGTRDAAVDDGVVADDQGQAPATQGARGRL